MTAEKGEAIKEKGKFIYSEANNRYSRNFDQTLLLNLSSLIILILRYNQYQSFEECNKILSVPYYIMTDRNFFFIENTSNKQMIFIRINVIIEILHH